MGLALPPYCRMTSNVSLSRLDVLHLILCFNRFFPFASADFVSAAIQPFSLVNWTMRNGPIWSQITKKMFLLFQPLSCRPEKSFKGPAAKLSSPLDCKLSRYVGEGKGRSENRMIQFSFSCGRRRKKFYQDRRNRGGNLCARLSVHFFLQPPPFFFFPRGQCSERTKSGGRTKEKKRKKRLLSIPSVPFSP